MPTLVSLFSGAGGLDIGLEDAGFQSLFATDADADCVQTLTINKQQEILSSSGRPHLSSAKIVLSDVADLSSKDILDSTGQELDLLVGGPPCQPFSSSGKQLSVLEKRGQLFLHFVRLAEEIQPRAILFENVRGLVTARGQSGEPGEALASVKASFEDIGYATSFALLNAADYGCPQRRVRLFMIAAKDFCIPSFPLPTHSRSPETGLFGSVSEWKTLGDLLSELPPPKDEEIVRPTAQLSSKLAEIGPGSGLKSPGRSEPTRPGGHWGYRQGTFIADPELPARTVTASSSQDWIRTTDGLLRRLTLRECAALQGFPVDWMFFGNKASQFRQVGNAVPVAFGQILGSLLRKALRQKRILNPTSEALPAYMKAAVAYTKRDHARNSVARIRTNSILESVREATPS